MTTFSELTRKTGRAVGRPFLAAHRGADRALAWFMRGVAATPRWLRRSVAVLAVAFVGLFLGVQLGGHGTYDVGPLQVKMSLHPSLHGQSEVEIPPLGAISIDSHDSPTTVRARVNQLDEHDAQQVVSDPKKLEGASKKAPDQIADALINLLARTAIAIAVVTLIIGLVVFRRFWRAVLSSAVALAVLAGVLGLSWGTWHPESIREPKYEGLLTKVPTAVGDARSIADNFDEYRGELEKFVSNMTQIYSGLSQLPDLEADPNSIRVLHVSDLHLNPAAWNVISSIVQQFKVNVVADTGDINDWGTPLEGSFADNIAKLNVPYVYIRGNHDSETTAEAVGKQPNAVVLDNAVREVAGLTFAGTSDGRFTPDKSEGDRSTDLEAVRTKNRELAATINGYNATHDKDVNVVLTHDPAGADEFAASGPLILAGHKHRRELRRVDNDTLLRVEGSTGASGLRGLYGDGKGSAMQMSLLYFSTDGVLKAADEISVSGESHSKLTLERKLVNDRTGRD